MSLPISQLEVLRRFRAAHGKRYNYNKVKYVSNNVDVTIICKVHGPFTQRPQVHWSGRNCNKCSYVERPAAISKASRSRKSRKTFVDQARQVHDGYYTYGKVLDEYVQDSTHIVVTCPAHGNFTVQVSRHLSGSRCAKCAASDRKGLRLTTKQFIEKAKQVHGGRFRYPRTSYVVYDEPVIITCPQHGDFRQTPSTHLSGYGCRQCTQIGYSRKSVDWITQEAKSRRMKNVQHAEAGGEFVIPGTRYRVDGYHAPTKTVFEFYGDNWHGNLEKYRPHDRPHPFSTLTAKQLYTRTMKREAELRELGYRVISTWESDYMEGLTCR